MSTRTGNGVGVGVSSTPTLTSGGLLILERGSGAPDQQHGARHRRSDARPQRDVDPFLLLHLDLHGADLRGRLVLRVGEAPVGDGQEPRDQQHDAHDAQRAHVWPTSLLALLPLPETAIITPKPMAISRPMPVQAAPIRCSTPVFHIASSTPAIRITYPIKYMRTHFMPLTS